MEWSGLGQVFHRELESDEPVGLHLKFVLEGARHVVVMVDDVVDCPGGEHRCHSLTHGRFHMMTFWNRQLVKHGRQVSGETFHGAVVSGDTMNASESTCVRWIELVFVGGEGCADAKLVSI